MSCHYFYFEHSNLLFQKEVRGHRVHRELRRTIRSSHWEPNRNLDLQSPTGPVLAGIPPPALVYSKGLLNVNTIDEFANSGAYSYNSLQVSLRHRVVKGLPANFNYTYSHNLDDVYHEYDGDRLVTAVFGFGAGQRQHL